MVNVISTFSGCGGSSIGYKRAGCKVLLALDFDPKAVETYNMNNGKIAIKKNIRETSGSELLSLAGLKKGELDILDGSPPCTPFSVVGKKEKGWGVEYKHSTEMQVQRTDDLFYEFIRLVDEARPKAFIAENVKGLITGMAKGYYNDILRKMIGLGYDVRVFNVNARDFEVPQSRPRIIFQGIRNDISKKGLKYPLKRHKPISFNDATKTLKLTDEDKDRGKINPESKIGKILKVAKIGVAFDNYGPTDKFFGYLRINPLRPCPTITTKRSLIHPYEFRYLVTGELKRVASFPDSFKFISENETWVRIGNSVPPNLTKHIALNTMKALIPN